MGKNCRCVVGVCHNEMRSPELHKKYSNMHGQTSNPLTVTDNSRKSSVVCKSILAWLIC